MNYFNRRNKYQIEYSGHEDVSLNLRERLRSAIDSFVNASGIPSYGSSRPSKVNHKNFVYAAQREFPKEDPFQIISSGEFYKAFTIVEIFWDLLEKIDSTQGAKGRVELIRSFLLSGSVYGINPRDGKIGLVIDEDLADKLKKTEEALSPYEHASRIFFEAVGNLVGRKAKPKDIVRDIFVASEEYLRQITGESKYASAIKEINKRGIINDEQKLILEKLYAFRSNTKGTTHAGDKKEPSEAEALWFVDTMSAQLRLINSNKINV